MKSEGGSFVVIALASVAIGFLILLALANTEFGRKTFFTIKGLPQ